MKIPVHLYERLAKRSPHERVDDGVDAGVDVGESFDVVDDEGDVLTIAVRDDEMSGLIRDPGDGERRRYRYAHPGHFARRQLLGRCIRTRPCPSDLSTESVQFSLLQFSLRILV